MIDIDRLTEDGWETLRALRLHALAEAPYAFWATHADEEANREADWRRFLQIATWYVARRDDRPIGLAAGLLREEAPDEPELIGMWVTPTERGAGVGSRLVHELTAWARGLGATSMTLWVTDGNVSAHELYARAGFAVTGERGTMPHGAASGMQRMRVALGPHKGPLWLGGDDSSASRPR